MSLSRREFLRLLGMAGAAGMIPGIASSRTVNADIYQMQGFGDIRLLHITDTHAQLLPIYYREPSLNLGVGEALGRPPHLVTASLLKYYGIAPDSALAHAFTPINYVDAAQRYGKVGGFAYLKTLVDKVRGEFGSARTLLFDSGDTWQGSGTAFWSKGADMVEVCNLLGVDVMTGHWHIFFHLETVRQCARAE